MSYTGKLFGVIPYEVRVSDTPIYSESEIEKMLSEHYGSVFAPMIYVKRVFNDDKHSGNIIDVDFFINCHGDDYPWFGEDEDESAVGLKFQNVPISTQEIDYAYQLFLGLETHFSRDRQLTIIHPNEINKHFSCEDQISAYNSAKEFIKTNQTIFDHMIKSDTPARLSFLIRAHLAGLEVDLLDTPDEIIKKLEQNLRSKENIVKRACKELGITQKELAEKLGVDDGTVRKWASEATKTPEWAEKFITLILEHDKNKKGIEHFKNFLNSVGV